VRELENVSERSWSFYRLDFSARIRVGVKGVPVMTVNPRASDAGTGCELNGLRNEFVDSLHHRSWIGQVPELAGTPPQRYLLSGLLPHN
jgi:hypothetical protein